MKVYVLIELFPGYETEILAVFEKESSAEHHAQWIITERRKHGTEFIYDVKSFIVQKDTH